MDPELSEISSFIHSIPPFDSLPKQVLSQLVRELSIHYVRKDDLFPPPTINEPRLYILRKGAMSCRSKDGELVSRLGESDLCDAFYHPLDLQSASAEPPLTVHVDEDCLLYSVQSSVLQEIGERLPSISDYFGQNSAQRLKTKMSQVNDEAILSSSLMNTAVSNFYQSPVAAIDLNETIQQTALQMTEQGYSCLVITEQNTPVGIVTDKDIRRRCVAQGLATSTPIRDIMTTDICSIDLHKNAYDALMMMTAKHVHHLPVTKSGHLVGMITVTDLINNEGHNAVNLSNVIHKANTVNELINVSKLLPKLQMRLAKLGSSADHVGKSISALTMAFTARLIEMAEVELGPPPVPFAWLAAGSQGRQEQLAHSDQDNALIISDSMQPEDDLWFAKLATFVSDGLANCGFIYCPGNIMATNPQWRQPQKIWHKYFADWVGIPNPQALLNSSVFFDLDTVYGEASLLREVRKQLLNKTKNNTQFIAHLSKNALNFRPPLGFFRDFVLKHSGKNKATLNLKHNGITPVIDLARIYALAEGIGAVNTRERIQQAAGTPSLSKESAENLIHAYEFLGMLRVKHQANQLLQGEKPDNYLSPKDISRLEREHLKDAFKVIKSLQDVKQSGY
ncbi:cyclic nucleotide-binding/CBS domain-containing protein [Colwellia echini]|uniref:Cyclic nucleotide-binding/CBS domain-containing protein n=2 Tax=Colwellia echini TaxID=1982103 RepID=A0ABY3MXU4_9GAMM|nr:putative nucleotidyltransferase substrate binding domain-containing protein [Colwellia echini]TYK65827.1 cyclic nucleotide-binding/CBS domain-containing protein [Colwellia echini]